VQVNFSAGPALVSSLAVEQDSFALAVDELLLNSTDPAACSDPPAAAANGTAAVAYTWLCSGYKVVITYEVLAESWGFLRKRVTVSPPAGAPALVVIAVNAWDVLLVRPASGASLQSVLYASGSLGGNSAFSRFSDRVGLMLALTNSFLDAVALPAASRAAPGAPAALLHAGHKASLLWQPVTRRRPDYSPFEADAGLLAAYPLTSLYVPPFPVWAPAPASAETASGPAIAAHDGVVALEEHALARVERVDFAAATAAPSNWTSANGYLATGYDCIANEVTTVEKAWARCESVTCCCAITFAEADGNPMPNGTVNVYYKDTVDFINSATWVTWFWEGNTRASLDYAERDALRAAADAHYLLPPAKTVKVNIAWTLNDYQIDNSNATQRPEYVRIIEMNAKIGVDHILYDGQNTNISSQSQDTDWWGYEALLWLNMAQSLREDRWYPSAGATLPPEVQSLVDAASAAGVNLIPYIYPILGWHTADPSWRQDPTKNDSFCTLEHQECVFPLRHHLRMRNNLSPGWAFC
jgi:hypothetical protein